MDQFAEIPSTSVYEKKKFTLPPPPAVSDGSDSSDEEDEDFVIKDMQKIGSGKL